MRVRVREAVEPGPCRMVWFPRAKEAAGGRSSWGCVRPAGCLPGVVSLTMPGGRLDRILAELSAGGKAWSSARLCGVCPGIAGVTGAGVMLMSGEIPRGSLCTSDGVSQVIEELQYTLGEGPCVDAHRQDTVVAEPDLADPVTRRWPVFTPPALQAGARAVFGFPLRVGTVRLGALNLYRDCPGPLSGDQHADALVVAGVAARWVLEAQAGAPPDTVAEELESGRRLPFRGAQRGGHGLGPGAGQRHRGAHPAAGVRVQPAIGCSPRWPGTSSPAGSGWDEPRSPGALGPEPGRY